MMRKVLAGCFVAVGILTAAVASYASDGDLYTVCTRDANGRVNLRTGPGTSFDVGLVQVGSGGSGIVQYFEQRNFTISHGENFFEFSTVENEDGQQWSKVGTNQWVAWVRSDFLCSADE